MESICQNCNKKGDTSEVQNVCFGVDGHGQHLDKDSCTFTLCKTCQEQIKILIFSTDFSWINTEGEGA